MAYKTSSNNEGPIIGLDFTYVYNDGSKYRGTIDISEWERLIAISNELQNIRPGVHYFSRHFATEVVAKYHLALFKSAFANSPVELGFSHGYVALMYDITEGDAILRELANHLNSIETNSNPGWDRANPPDRDS